MCDYPDPFAHTCVCTARVFMWRKLQNGFHLRQLRDEMKWNKGWKIESAGNCFDELRHGKALKSRVKRMTIFFSDLNSKFNVGAIHESKMLQTFNLSLNSKLNKKSLKINYNKKSNAMSSCLPQPNCHLLPSNYNYCSNLIQISKKNAVPALDTEKKCRKHKKELASPDVCLCLNESE
jgi:hypothetical protein